MDRWRWSTTGAAPRISAIPTASTQMNTGPEKGKEPPLTCSYHAVHIVTRRVGHDKLLKGPYPNAEREIPQVRTRKCKILPVAAVEGKFDPQTSRPIQHNT